ncbi:dockerin-like protein [Gilvimarinus sp. DA14]|uniref:glucuronyl esterase domain-containing protein n=1 Tax=Gilvimarinus sp. DA14 TaxID=2956798 RepID=UPI0020B86896|nr:dockerin-like protein [Gilvimarinus sp. DA14]UTF60173.1 dockerin-like protein [Gilvimarinus sp. DA14]
MAIGQSIRAGVFCMLLASFATQAAPLKEDSSGDCSVLAATDYQSLTAISALPDPFLTPHGERISHTRQWRCQRAYLSEQLQHWVYGEKPAPQGGVSAQVNARSITINVTKGTKRIAYTAEITLPSAGKPPYPAIIAVGRSFLDNQALLQQGIAIINFPNDELGEQHDASSRGKGKFYALFGEDHSAASTVAWAWGVSRLIDGLQQTQGNQINTNSLGITGCSRNGKGALVSAALDERLALSIIQESGAGGTASWRVSDAQLATGDNVQTARQIVTENTWLKKDFARFAESVSKLPVDNHQLMGLVAPRGLLLLENTDMEWLGNQSAYVSALAAREIYRALGADNNIGMTQIGGHQHCQVPESQKPAINAFVERFLLQQNTETNVWESDGEFNAERERWIPWSTPVLAP